jgi:hypothetical protein
MRERLKQIADYYGLSIRKFEKECDLKRGNISNISDNGTIGVDKLSKIIDKFPNLDIGWLLTGKGEMLKKNEVIEQNGSDIIEFLREMLGEKDKKIEDLKEEIGALKDQLKDYAPTRKRSDYLGATNEDSTVAG